MVQIVQQTFGIEIAACHLIKGGEVDGGAYFIGLVVAFSGVFQAFAGTCDGRIGLEAVVEAEQLIVQSGFAAVVATGYQGFAAGEYFGIYDICGKGAAFMGTTLVGVAVSLTNSINIAVGTLSVLFICGIFFFRKALKA